MNPIKYDLEIWQGKTFEKPFFFKDADDKIIKFDGYTARMQLRSSLDASDVEIELTSENGRIIIDSERGSVTLLISAEDTASLRIGSFKYDLELVTASGRVYGPFYGKVKVKGEVTR